MKIIDEKGRLFKRINIVDLCVVLAIAAVLLVFFVKGSQAPAADKAPASIEYTINVRAVRKASVDALTASVGDTLSVQKTGEALGTLSSADADTAMGYIVTKDGSYAKTEYPDKFDVVLKVTTNGTQNSSGVYTEGGKQLLIGEQITFVSDGVQTAGEVTGINIE